MPNDTKPQATGRAEDVRVPHRVRGKCKATTRSGRRCTTVAVVGEEYCVMHSQSPQTQALMAQARRLGGAAPRARVGLQLDVISLRDGEGQIRLLEGVVRALATSAISSATATAIVSAVKTAAQIVGQDQAEAIRKLEERVASMVIGR